MANALSEGAQHALKLYQDGQAFHDRRIADLDKLEEAYHGELKTDDEAADWTSKLHPPYIQHIVETTLAGLVDDRFAWRVLPADRFYDPGELERVKAGAKAHERLHRCQLKQDRFNELMRPFAQQAAIKRLSVAKTTWKQDTIIRPHLETIPGVNGLPVVRPSEPTKTTRYDGPHTIVVNVEDFFWHEAAPSLDEAMWLAHRVWMTPQEVAKLEREGVFQNTKDLKENKQSAVSQDGTRDRTKDLIEILEIWYLTDTGYRVATIGNQRVELKPDRPNPFWHGRHPFVGLSLQPALFQVEGVSQVEKIQHLQLATWDLMNQTHDNLRLINNFMMVVRPDMLDPDFKYGPGETVFADDPSAVQPLKVDPIGSQVALPHLQRLEQQMQNLAGSQPFTTTSEGQVNASTATQAALVTDLASRSLQAQKAEIYRAYERIGQLRTELNQQFIRTPIIVSELGIDNEQEFQMIVPELLRGDYLFDGTPMAESQMRSERKAEAQGMLQMALQMSGPLLALASQGHAKYPNIDRYVTDWLEANDVKNTEAYFLSSAPQAPPGGLPGMQPQGQPQAEGPGGVTAPQSIDPAVSPSNQASISPSQFMQRAFASQGGANAGPAPNPTPY